MRSRFLVVALMVLAAPAAFACKCVPPPLGASNTEIAQWRAEKAEVIFEGKVTALEFKWELVDAAAGEWIAADDFGKADVVAHLRISRTYRGANRSDIEIAAGLGAGDCGFEFEVGQEYLVYAYEDEEGELGTSICSGTALVKNSATNLAYLRGEAVVPDPTKQRAESTLGKVCGRVVGPAGAHLSEGNVVFLRNGRMSPVARDQVSVEEDGSFCESSLEPGKYHVVYLGGPEDAPTSLAFFPDANIVSRAAVVEVQPAQAIANLEIKVPLHQNFKVRGKVLVSESVLSTTELRVMLTSSEHPTLLLTYTTKIGRDGTFLFPRVLSGKYWGVVGINFDSEDEDGSMPQWLTRKIEVNVDSDIADLALELIRN